jgi:hypothetical protein
VKLRDLVEPCPFLVGPVEIVIRADLRLGAGLDESVGYGARRPLLGNMQRPGIAVQGIAAALVVLRPRK